MPSRARKAAPKGRGTHLTWFLFESRLSRMRFRRAILVAFVGLALGSYVVDCSGMTTPDEANNCCQSMPCSSSGHNQECCKTMPQMHAPFIQAPSAHRLSFTPGLIAVLPVFQEPLILESTTDGLVASLHAPPGTSPPATKPIRI